MFQVHARDPPSTYLTKIRTYLDPTAYKSTKKIRSLGDSTSTQVLRNLEISLRTNNIEWVQEFLGPEHGGLDVLVEYLTRFQCYKQFGCSFSSHDVPKSLFKSFKRAYFI